MRGTPREKEGFKVRERGRDATREDCRAYRRRKSIPSRGTYAHKGPGLSHCGPNTGNKKVKPVRGSERTL